MKLNKLFGLCFLTMTLASMPLSAAKKKKKSLSRQKSVAIEQQILNSVLNESPESHSIVELLKIYKVYDANGPIPLRRIGRAYDGGYVIPELAMQAADLVMGYGIETDISFEDSATAIYGKPSYGFDCTSKEIKPSQKECRFIPSCIVGEGVVSFFQNSATFDEHLAMVGGEGKKLFIKMDIEGNEYGTLPDILKHAERIAGIVLEIHFVELQQIPVALDLLQRLDKDFILAHVHGNNCCSDTFVTSNAAGKITRVLELSYINRNLIHHAELARDQSHPTALDMPNNPHLPDVSFVILSGQFLE